MKIKIYLLWLAVAVMAFVFGISVISVGRYFQSVFSAKEQKTELVEPVKAEQLTFDDIIYPPRNVEKTETAVTPMMEKTDDAEKRNRIRI